MIIVLIILIYIIGAIITSAVYHAVACLDYKRCYGEYDKYTFNRYFEIKDWDLGVSIGAIFWPVGLIVAGILYIIPKINLEIEKRLLYNERTNSTVY